MAELTVFRRRENSPINEILKLGYDAQGYYLRYPITDAKDYRCYGEFLDMHGLPLSSSAINRLKFDFNISTKFCTLSDEDI